MLEYFTDLTSTYPHSSNPSWVLVVTTILPKHRRETLPLRKKKNLRNQYSNILWPMANQKRAATEEVAVETQSKKEPPEEEVVRDMGLDGRGICR
jgi:hypothetical protein